MDCPKYQYHALTWGGFYNTEYKSIHGLEEGDFLFDKKEDRDAFINNRKEIKKQLSAQFLLFHLTEGFCCDTRTIVHRVIEFEGVNYYSQRDLGISYPFSSARYYLENKWYPGFNDCPLGEDFDYDKVKTVKEWITGAWQDIDEF
jgi:hypothetical protein